MHIHWGASRVWVNVCDGTGVKHVEAPSRDEEEITSVTEHILVASYVSSEPLAASTIQHLGASEKLCHE